MPELDERAARPILFVHPSDELYGSDRCLLSVIRSLPDRYRAIVALPTDVAYSGSLSRELRAIGAQVHGCNMLVLRRAYLRPAALAQLGWRCVMGAWSLARLIRRERVALLHSNTVVVPCGVSLRVVPGTLVPAEPGVAEPALRVGLPGAREPRLVVPAELLGDTLPLERGAAWYMPRFAPDI